MKSLLSALFVALFVHYSLAAPAIGSEKPSSHLDGHLERAVTLGEIDRFMVVLGVSPCMSSCILDMQNKFNSTSFNATDDPVEDFRRVCDSYFEAAECFKKCDENDEHMFEIFSSGAKYMCVEEREAFERAMPCIRKEQPAMKEECREKCHVSEDAKNLFDTPESGERPSNATAVFEEVNDVCITLQCSIECGRDYLNEHCDRDQHVGTLLTEVVIRPLEKNAEFLASMAEDMQQKLTEALPKGCAYLVNAKELDAMRHGASNFVHGNENENQNEVHTDAPVQSTEVTTPFSSSSSSTPSSLQSVHRRRRSNTSPNPLAYSVISAADAMKYYL